MSVIRFLSRARWVLAAALIATLLTACGVTSGPSVHVLGVGNQLPSGAHYNLNIIGVAKDKTASMDTGNGHRIFVPLWGNAKIYLQPGDDFAVLDANGTDQDGATFQLPNPDPTNSGTTAYSVYARELGTPGGSSSMTTCATDPVSGDQYCSIYSALYMRDTGKPKTQNVSKDLLYVYADLDGTGVKRYPLFDSALEGYFWEYDNNGLKVVQLRFYLGDNTTVSAQ